MPLDGLAEPAGSRPARKDEDEEKREKTERQGEEKPEKALPAPRFGSDERDDGRQ